MIRPLRTRHRVMVTVLAVTLPILFVAGLLARKPPAEMEALPEAIPFFSETYPRLLDEAPNLWGELAILTRLHADATPASHLAVELHPEAYLKAPDVLVYWHVGALSAEDIIPDGAYLLGGLAGTRAQHFALPDTALHTDGHLILYSLGHQQMIATASLSSKQP